MSLTSTLAEALRDRYVVERELGHGGMATVYLARDLKHDRLVALKLLRPELTSMLGPDRFLREIRLTAQLQHPHLLTVLDSGENAGLLWYTMPFVEGGTLRARLERERELTLGDALTISRNVSAALTCAHRHGIIHRDVKPENILLEDGEALLADFGIARALAQAGTRGDALTGTGLALGTPAYMSPEQASGERDLDTRADVYSLGCVLYEMLAGEPPYTGPNPQAIMAKRFSDPVPSIRRIRPEIPLHVDRAIQRALARRPADRLATPEQFANALDHKPASYARRTPRAVLAVVVAAALAAGLVWWMRRQPSSPPTTASRSLAVLPFRTNDPGLQLWREGLVDLFSLALDGAGELRTIHPRTVLSRWRRNIGNREVDENTTLDIARELGARYALSGTLLNLGPKVRLVGQLYQLSGGSPRTAVVEGSLDSLPRLVDLASIALLRAGFATDSSARPLATLAEVTTTSLPALKDFLAGEQNFRRGRQVDAAQNFEQAVKEDSGFTLAEFRLGAAQGWSGSVDTPDGPSSRVLAAIGRLPRRDVLLVRGSWELSHELHAALATFDTLVREYPADAEAWYMLGDTYYHIGMLHGVPPGSIESALRRAIELDPSFMPAYIHLTEMAFERLDSVEARRLVGAVNYIDSTSPKAIGLSVAWSLAWGDSLQRQHADQLLRSISGDALITAKHALNLAPDLAPATERVAGATAAQGRLSLRHRVQALDGLALSHELRGHLKQDLAIRSRLAGLMDSAGFIVNWAPLIPGILRAEGYPVRLEQHPRSPPWPGDHVLWGLWLYGLAASGEGRSDDLKRTLRALRHFAESPRTQGDTTFSVVGIERREAAAYVNALLGFEALRHGDGAAATRHFSQAADSLRPLTTDVTVVDYQLGKLLLGAGHPADAERYMLTSQRWRAGMETELLVPREYYLGQIAEARGNPSVAREHYARFVRWWRDCDPELKPWWEGGRRGLVRVSGDQGEP